MEFNDHHIPEEIKTRINQWIEDIIDSATLDTSNIKTEELQKAFSHLEILSVFMSKVFSFFINSISMSISQKKSESISLFIA